MGVKLCDLDSRGVLTCSRVPPANSKGTRNQFLISRSRPVPVPDISWLARVADSAQLALSQLRHNVRSCHVMSCTRALENRKYQCTPGLKLTLEARGELFWCLSAHVASMINRLPR